MQLGQDEFNAPSGFVSLSVNNGGVAMTKLRDIGIKREKKKKKRRNNNLTKVSSLRKTNFNE